MFLADEVLGQSPGGSAQALHFLKSNGQKPTAAGWTWGLLAFYFSTFPPDPLSALQGDELIVKSHTD